MAAAFLLGIWFSTPAIVRAQAHRIVGPAPGLLEAGAPNFAIRSPEALGLDAPPTDLHLLPDGRMLAYAAGQLAIGDGLRWEVFPQSPDDKPTSSTGVAVNSDGEIYTGVAGGFARIKFQENGQWRLQSAAVLTVEGAATPPVLEFSLSAGDEWYWHSGSGPLVAWRPDSAATVVARANTIDAVLRLRDARYVSDRTSGRLWRFDVSPAEAVPFADTISVNDTMTCSVLFDPDRLLVGTYARGLMLFDGQRVVPFVSSGPLAGDVRINALCTTEGGMFAAAVENLGIVFFDRQGRTVQVLDRGLDHRLSHVQRLLPTPGGTVWALLGDGILSVEFPSRISQYEPLLGSGIATAHPYRVDGRLWVLADGRVRRGRYDPSGRLTALDVDTPPEGFAFAFSTASALPVVGTDRGAYFHDGKSWVPFAPDTVNLRVLDTEPIDGRWLYGAQREIGWLRRTATGFERESQPAPELENIFNSQRDADGSVWIELGSGRLGRIRTAGQLSLEIFGREAGLPEGWAQLFLLDGRVGFNVASHILRFDPMERRFEPDFDFSRRFPALHGIIGRPGRDASGRLWITANGAVQVLEQQGSTWRNLGERIPPGLLPYFFCFESDGVVWMHADRRLTRFDPQMPVASMVPLRALISHVQLPASGRNFVSVGRELPALPFSDNSISVHFVAAGHTLARPVQFDVMLEGAARDWVPAGSSGSTAFNRLKEGRYVLHVRPRSGDSLGEEATVAFRINPPWYRSPAAYSAYTLGALGLVALIAWLSSYLQRRENIRLERLVQHRTRELNESNLRYAAQVEEIRRLSQAVEQSPVGILLTLPDGAIEFANPRFTSISGYSLAELIGRSLHTLWGAPLTPEVEEQISTALSVGESWHGQLSNRTRDGRVVPVRVTLSPIRSPDGLVRHHLVLEEDIAEWLAEQERRRRLEGQLFQAQKLDALGTLAGGIAHDFNNILTGILGFCELATQSPNNDSAVRQDLVEIRAAGMRAKDLVARILTFSRQQSTQLVPLDLATAVREALQLLRASTPATIEFETTLSPGVIRGDSTQIQQVVVNLCTNAVHAMHNRSGRIQVVVQPAFIDSRLAAEIPDLPPGAYLRLTVADTGHGMDPSTLDRIFEPFFTTKNPGEGTGLGLAIVRTIVANHRGTLRVQSTPAVGTTFELFFPRSNDQPAVAITTTAVPAGGNRTVLVVDDEHTVGSFVFKRLQQLGYRPELFKDSRAALAAFQAAPERFQAIVTDLTMPYMTGIELIQQIRRQGRLLPAIIMTGYSQELARLQPQTMMARCLVLQKPFTGEALSQLLDQVIKADGANGGARS